jgi:NAD(P)-dependent dehydrogenase (short-subunit alcohol dehydrogenase family)
MRAGTGPNQGLKLTASSVRSDATQAVAEIVQAVQAAGGDAFALQGDLTKVAAVVRLCDEAVKRYGRVDIAITTVGQVLKKPFVETTEEEYDRMFAINVKATYFCIQEAGNWLSVAYSTVIITARLLRFCLCLSHRCLIRSRATLASAAQPDTFHSLTHPQRYCARAEATK